jgi:hypothetical protein
MAVTAFAPIALLIAVSPADGVSGIIFWAARR